MNSLSQMINFAKIISGQHPFVSRIVWTTFTVTALFICKCLQTSDLFGFEFEGFIGCLVASIYKMRSFILDCRLSRSGLWCKKEIWLHGPLLLVD